MSRLALSLMGPFQASLEERPIVGFRSDKARALLVYLAVEAVRPHAREALAGLLWPDYPNATALTYLRSALANLRRLLDAPTAGLTATPSPFLLITRDTVQFNPAADAWLDTVALARLLEEPPTGDVLEQAVALCRGPFLEGFSAGPAAAFDEWLLYKREQLNRQQLGALHRLTATYLAQGQFAQAGVHARRQIALDPWDEAAHRQLMLSLALDGHISAALAQYEACRQTLADGLAIAPARATTDLRDRIQAGALPDVRSQPREAIAPAPVFVARGRELARLDSQLTLALAGHGRAIFVAGEAGSGKTSLMHEFARRAVVAQRSVVVVSGRCSSIIGLDDPYLPFREIIQTLTGDIEVWRAGSALVLEHTQRLWDAAPAAVEALVNAAPGLIGRFVDGEALALRADAMMLTGVRSRDGSPQAQLAGRVKRQAERTAAQGALAQTDAFAQVTAFLRALARQHPLILLLDDLQWADQGSISLLFHLARYIADSRILIVGAYRPEDVVGHDGARHPLTAVVHELQRETGNIELDLDQTAGWPFVSALLDREPNRLDESFRDTFYRHTEGQPLFAVELLTSLQEGGGLVRDAAGQWIEGAALNWETLPARVEAVIAERVDRLAPEQQALLRAASVEGEEFTAEVVAQALGMAERDVVAQLTAVLSRGYRLVRGQSVQRVEGRSLSRYRFRHHLFWQYLYQGLDEPERTRLHEAVGLSLESLTTATGDQGASRAPQLAWHFEQAGWLDKAVDYRQQAGDQAMRLSACEEAIAHYMRGLALLATLPASPARAERETALRLALSSPLAISRGWGGPEMSATLTRAYELTETIGARSPRMSTLLALSIAYSGQGETQKGLALGNELLELAYDAQDAVSLARAHQNVGVALFLRGDVRGARHHLEQALALYDAQPPGPVSLQMGVDEKVSCLAWLAWPLWALGYPDQATHCRQAALARADELGQPSTLAFALAVAGALFGNTVDQTEAGHAYEEALLRIATTKGLALYRVLGMLVEGLRRVERGQVEAGIAEIQGSVAEWQAMGTMAGRVLQLAVLIVAYRRAGQVEQALRTVDEALTVADENDLRYSEAELWRVKGELLACREPVDAAGVEACFQQAIALARQQEARWWELRATTCLARLWQQQGRVEEAYSRLAAIYAWFNEGFDTADLVEARALLAGLGYASMVPVVAVGTATPPPGGGS